ncbi:hypothetical protein FPQ18DRAFT_345702 [Pyronema domesticum]|uniref:Similar to Twinfilin-2 acc. no. Q6GMH3 n=1 Tax=Pyronema omphalodes (strain CBS 100304) TaxID=1076935 RepID=U4L253_PYROM|nr:hypothetical protein FPQ18DRAFT_345702 [Pyronema domesticum]CCX06348.1 Similar to Twinfilin-2; acc. no. Q6GMH3 [Pyronema omphalodes CBS 100304]
MSSSGIVLPFSADALDALSAMKAGGFVNLVQLAINLEKEVIELAGASTSVIRDFTKVVTDDAPRYSFFVFKHTYEGEEQAPLIFIYTCPPASKLKEKMMYAACRAAVIATVENECGLRITRKMEAASIDEIAEIQLIDELHPKAEVKETFARPKRPGRRGTGPSAVASDAQ